MVGDDDVARTAVQGYQHGGGRLLRGQDVGVLDLRQAGITCISITDSLTSPVAQACEMSLTCNTEHDVLFNSVSSVIAMIEVLTSGLLLSDRERFLTAQERLERLEEKLGIPQKDQQFVRTDIQRQTLK